jgi:phosphoglycolate phosphatase
MGVNMKYKAVIFDLDGTLLDTISDISDSFNATLKKYNYPTFSEEKYKYFVGKGIDVLIHRIMERLEMADSEFEKLKQGYIEEYAIRHNAKTKVYSGIMDLLNELKRDKVKVSILSNKPHFQTIEVIQYYFKNFDFDLVYGKKPEFDIKPNPASALDLIAKLNLSAEDVLYIGDTDTDIETAINASFTSVGVLWGFRKKLELINAGANYIVEKPIDIYKIVVGDGDDFKAR